MRSDPKSTPLDVAAIYRRIQEGGEVKPHETERLLRGDGVARQIAHLGLFRSTGRAAVDHLAALAREQGYSDQGVVNLLAQLGPQLNNELPVLEMTKEFGFTAARDHRVEDALRYLQHMWVRAEVVGQQRDVRSRAAMKLVSEPAQIDRVLVDLARSIAPVSAAPRTAEPVRCAILVGHLADENSITNVAMALGRGLRERGMLVRFISTESSPTGSSKSVQGLRTDGFPVHIADQQAYLEKIAGITGSLEAEPVHVAVWVISAIDVIGKVLSCSGIARAQVLLKISYTHHCGRFNHVMVSIDPSEIADLPDPGTGVFTGSPVVLGDRIDAAQPFDRAALGIPPGSLMLGCYGRLQKVVSAGYSRAVAEVLKRAPNAYLVLAGPDINGADRQRLQELFANAGVAERVRYLGSRYDDVPALLKATDIYCDTFPWPGGQSILEAIHAGIAVVGMKTMHDPDLDHTGSVTSAAERFLPGDGLLAQPGDVDGYVELVLRLAGDAELRRSYGQRLHEHSRANYGLRDWVQRVERVLRASIAESL
ncbi:MAG: glycosyltransferase family 4 protein [bacterium]|nr:glycosyltransferase family 4 protein [bacterium]